jgi:hypothetical protein
MYCPKCGSNQGEGKRFCTVCGTNLAAVSQALTGQLPQPAYYAPPIPHPFEIERQKTMAKGVRLTIIGGGFLALQFINFLFSGFRGSPAGFWTIAGVILLAIGIPKIIASRPPGVAGAANSPAPAPHQTYSIRQTDSLAGLSAPAPRPAVPQTSELEPVGSHATSVIEDETRHLPPGDQQRDLSK